MSEQLLNKYILIQEEYGFRHWVGQVPDGMTVEQLIAWWEALPSVAPLFFNPSEGFPMSLMEVEDVADDDAEIASWSWTDDQGVQHILNRETVVAFFHTHEEDDSYMKVVGGGHHYHAGYGSSDPDDDFEDDDDLEPLTLEDIQDLKDTNPHVYDILSKSLEEAQKVVGSK